MVGALSSSLFSLSLSITSDAVVGTVGAGVVVPDSTPAEVVGEGVEDEDEDEDDELNDENSFPLTRSATALVVDAATDDNAENVWPPYIIVELLSIASLTSPALPKNISLAGLKTLPAVIVAVVR